MIGYLEGKLIKRESDRILLLANQVGFEVLVPAIVMETLKTKDIGVDISLYIYYQQTERQPKPVLIGFNREIEKEFFQYFISVEDIGPLKGVKALNIPVWEMANAIESKDADKLKQLKGIGNRTAQKIIAALSGKMEKFMLITEEVGGKRPGNDDIKLKVLDVLVSQLGYKTAEARIMIDEALKRKDSITTPEELIEEVYLGEKKS